MRYDLVSIILILSMGQCLFLLVSSRFNNLRNQPANILLGMILLAFLWYQAEFFLIRTKLDATIPFVYGTRFGSWLLIGPLIWLYNRSILIKGFVFKREHIWHFVPLIVFTILVPLALNDLITKRAVDYGMLTVFDNWNKDTVTWRHYLYGGIFFVQFLHALCYFILAYRETRAYQAEAKNHYSNIDQAAINTRKYLFIGATTVILFCSLFILYQIITRDYRRHMDYVYVLPMVAVIYFMVYRALRYPNSLISFQEFSIKKKYQKSSLSSSAATEYLQKLEHKVWVEKWYRNQGLSLRALAEELEITTHHLSQIINESHNKNFFDYINSFRVKEAQHLIQNSSDKNLLEIAYKVGFNNKNSFNNAFKKHTGRNPSSFKKVPVTG